MGESVGESVGGAAGQSLMGMGLSFFEMPFAKKKRGRESTSQQAGSFSMLMVQKQICNEEKTST